MTTKCYDDYISISNNNFAMQQTFNTEKTQNKHLFTVDKPQEIHVANMLRGALEG